MALRSDLLPENSRIVQPSYIEKYTNKKDLVRRLKALDHVLEKDHSIEPDSPEWPGLAATATLLVQKQFLEHKDKQVRLYTALACNEIFAIYAPECPYDENEILSIFKQTIRQLANLAHTTDPTKTNFSLYARILDLFAEVRIGVVLVELAKNNEEEDLDDCPLDVLAELFHTLLHAVRNEHPKEIPEMVEKAINACLDEYNQGFPVPIKLLDEILICIGQGPTVLVNNPAAHQQQASRSGNKKKSSSNNNKKIAFQIEQSNPSYVVAANILRHTLNRTATPVAQLLNGLLNGDSHVVEQSSIQVEQPSSEDKDSSSSNNSANVYSIVYELHRVAPQILTTVIGTVSNGLRSPQATTRHAAVELLGRLFCAPNAKLASKFQPCFREWLGRQQDVETEIRRVVVKSCVKMLQTKNSDDVLHDVNQTLMEMVTADLALDVRLDAIFQVCDLAYRSNNSNSNNNSSSSGVVSAALLQAIGGRVSSKFKEERKNAVTGLAQLYFRNFVQNKLQHVQIGGDDCDLSVILEALHDTCHLEHSNRRNSRKRKGRRSRSENMDFDDEDNDAFLDADEEMYGWIPRKVVDCTFYTDQTDTEMRSRVVQILDEVILGSDLSSNRSKNLTPTARAVGLAMILDSLREGGENLLTKEGIESDSVKFLKALFGQRAKLQKAVGSYLDARAKVREYESGTEQALVADAKARQLLDLVASLTAPVSGSSTSLDDVLNAFHGARDKHIFRILSTITDPCQKPKTRARALEELPKRTKSLGDDVSAWVKNLVRRCQMGDFINVDIVGHCALLAQECFSEEDVPACASLLACVKIAADIFPSLCGPPETFDSLTQLFSDCRSVSSGDLKKDVADSGIVTALSSILSSAAASSGDTVEKDIAKDNASEDLKDELLQLCTRDGTPEQARNAVYTLARLFAPHEKDQKPASPAVTKEETESFSPLLKALTSPTRMTISSKEESPKVISILSALSALTECAPGVFSSSARGQKAIKFALETILMGRSGSGEDGAGGETASSDDDETDEEDEATTPASSSRKKRSSSSSSIKKRGNKNITPEATTSLLEDEKLSVACRRVCAAIDFLASYVRSSLLCSQMSSSSDLPLPSDDQIQQIFQILSQILRDHGLPPSNRDRRACKARQDRAALRQCAAIYLLRLCDSRLGLEKKYLSPTMWHTFSCAFLDEERVVREAIMEEFSLFLRGTGMYGVEGSRLPAKAPALRFVSLIALCTDGDHGLDNDAANGNAANIGRHSVSVKNAAIVCVVNLRKTCDALYNQCRATGKNAEENFDKRFKMLLMPEYTVPYAFHLLSLRRETPSSGATSAAEDDDDAAPTAVDEDSQHRVLRKRLKLLFEPLVQTLGDGGDNISFLIKMTEVMGKSYEPIDVAAGLSKPVASSPLRLSIGSDSSMDTKPRMQGDKRAQLLTAKLKTVCVAAEQVLLGLVKRDRNLTPYPGRINLPGNLFRKSHASKQRASQQSSQDSVSISQDSSKVLSSRQSSQSRSILASSQDTMEESRMSSASKRKSASAGVIMSAERIKKSRVHFSPEVEIKLSGQHAPLTGEENKSDFGVSPIAKSSPDDSEKRSSSRRSTRSSGSKSVDTLGTSPPFRIATVRSTAPDSEESPASSKVRSPIVQSEIRASPSGGSHDSTGFADDEDDGLKSTLDTTASSQDTAGSKGRTTRSQSRALKSKEYDEDDGIKSSLDTSQDTASSKGRTTRSQSRTQKAKESPAEKDVDKKDQDSQESTVDASKGTRRSKRKIECPTHDEDSIEESAKPKASRRRSVPTQIKFTRVKLGTTTGGSSEAAAKKKKTRKRRGMSQQPVDEFDFDFVEDEMENQRNTRTRKPPAAKEKSSKTARTLRARAK